MDEVIVGRIVVDVAVFAEAAGRCRVGDGRKQVGDPLAIRSARFGFVVAAGSERTRVDAAGSSAPAGIAAEDARIAEQTLGQLADDFEDVSSSAVAVGARQLTAADAEVVRRVGNVGQRKEIPIGILLRFD